MNVSGFGSSEALVLESIPFLWPTPQPQSDDGASSIIPATEWAKQRCRIRQLYLVDGLTREQTRLIMKHRYGFDASNVQYKYKIKKWKFQKSLTDEDKQFLARCTSRNPKPSVKFLLCGQPIKRAKILRKVRGTPIARDRMPPRTQNMISYDTDDDQFDADIRELRSKSLIQGSNPESLYACCVTCVRCELDFYSSVGYKLWQEILGCHLIRCHAKYSYRFALVWSKSDPALQNAPDHELVCDWNYVPGDPFFFDEIDGMEIYDTDLCPDFTTMLKLLGSMSSTSVIQEETQEKSLWLVDKSDDNEMKTLALITRRAEKTPQDLIQSILAEISSQAGT